MMQLLMQCCSNADPRKHVLLVCPLLLSRQVCCPDCSEAVQIKVCCRQLHPPSASGDCIVPLWWTCVDLCALCSLRLLCVVVCIFCVSTLITDCMQVMVASNGTHQQSCVDCTASASKACPPMLCSWGDRQSYLHAAPHLHPETTAVYIMQAL